MADLIQALNGLSDEQRALMAHMPIATPPAGIQSNFVNPPSRTPMQTWVTTTFLVIAMVFYMNRVYVKTALMKTWTWDDVTLALTVVLTVGQYITVLRGATNSIMGRHLWDISLAQMLDPELPPICYAILVLTPWSLLFLKVTFFVLYLHLFYRIRWIRICSWVGIVYVVLTMGGTGIYVFAVANPYENMSWTITAVRLGIPVGVMGLIADIAVFVLPIAAIVPLQISRSKRFGALLIFLTGGSALICAALNIYFRHRLLESTDGLWDGVPGYISSLCEILLGVTSACMPSAAYGFRHKDSVYNRILHPSQYFGSRQYASKQYNSRQYHSSISKPVTPQGFAIADAEELIPRASRTQIRCETSVEVSSSECDAEEKVEAREEQPWEEAKDVELAILQPAHLAAPHKLQRRVSVNDVEVQRVLTRR